MRNILKQIVGLYPNENVTVITESGDFLSGRPHKVTPSTNGGLFILADKNCKTQKAISICHIASVRIPCGTYSNCITYLPTPCRMPEGCCSDCIQAIRTYLPQGTTCAEIKIGGHTVAQGTVKKSEFGILAFVEQNNTNPTFVSACKAEVITKQHHPCITR